jgi:hypothetical protein
MGVYLPCNVVVRVNAAGVTELEAVNPSEMARVAPEVATLAEEVKARLTRVLAAVGV